MRHFMLSRSSPHSASAIVSAVSQGTRASVRISMTVTFFPAVNSTVPRIKLSLHAMRCFPMSAFIELRIPWCKIAHQTCRDVKIRGEIVTSYKSRTSIRDIRVRCVRPSGLRFVFLFWVHFLKLIQATDLCASNGASLEEEKRALKMNEYESFVYLCNCKHFNC